MFRIRFHGRGGEGIKTASRILGSSFFFEGFQVQDAPKYGAERRGAPVSAYVRADHKQIYERGEIHKPDLIIIADETLLHVTRNTVLEGIYENTVIFIISAMSNSELEEIINCGKTIIKIAPAVLPENYHRFLSSITASATARFTGIIQIDSLIRGVEEELKSAKNDLILENTAIAKKIFNDMTSYSGIVTETDGTPVITEPQLIDLPLHNSSIATPAIRTGSTSVKNQTGSWRTSRPVILQEKCSRCMLCNVYCPDSAITKNEEGFPVIDYNHCKGCLICREVCPSGAITQEDEKTSRSKTV
jgi:pyruvate ferredoxin oxidoreductase gamma subunit